APLVGAGILAGDSLDFRIERNGVTFVEKTFTSNSELQNFFANTVLFLGTATAGLNGADVQLKIIFELDSIHPTNGISAQFLVGGTPNPPIEAFFNPSGGSWNTPTNWQNNSCPCGPGTGAEFNSASGGPITVDSDTTVGTVEF